jgi:sulfoxide reductase catalytic subunit YedY
MLIKKAEDIRSSEITSKNLYLNRRKFLAGAAVAGVAAASGVGLREMVSPSTIALAGNKIDGISKSPFSTTEAITPYKDVTTYNNYYEFSTDKDGPAKLAQNFRTHPWTVKIDGQVDKSRNSMSTRSARWPLLKSASTVIAASKVGPSSFPG